MFVTELGISGVRLHSMHGLNRGKAILTVKPLLDAQSGINKADNTLHKTIRRNIYPYITLTPLNPPIQSCTPLSTPRRRSVIPKFSTLSDPVIVYTPKLFRNKVLPHLGVSENRGP